jgi:guanylate kinase
MSHYREFDYVVVNDDFDRAVEQLAQIIRGNGEPYAAGRRELAAILANLLASSPP